MKFIRIFLTLLRNLSLRFRWLFLDTHLDTKKIFIAHLLVVKNTRYAILARTCIESFLYFHPKSLIKIHCDSVTYPSLRKALRPIQIRHHQQISYQIIENAKSWQENKLGLILSLSGTSDIFMDADLKWNGAIQTSLDKTITFFVNEGESKYLEVLSHSNFSINIPELATMKNTSFFCWGNLKLNSMEVDEVMNLFHSIQEVVLGSSPNLLREIERLSEQIALSLIPELFERHSSFLKKSDSQFDGSIVESSYFGSSGGRFAIWGNTNRQFYLN
jgi:hypothetical protein